MRLTRAFSPSMAKKKQGTIINIASISGEDIERVVTKEETVYTQRHGIVKGVVRQG
jgi:short-subunit dehydrogenase